MNVDELYAELTLHAAKLSRQELIDRLVQTEMQVEKMKAVMDSLHESLSRR